MSEVIVLIGVQSSLTDRTQHVCVKSTNSSWLPVTVEVPQELTLGPHLFFLYKKGISVLCRDLQFVHFAEDLSVLAKGADLRKLCSTLHRELKAEYRWLRFRTLSPNISKSLFMIVTSRKKIGSILFPRKVVQ